MGEGDDDTEDDHDSWIQIDERRPEDDSSNEAPTSGDGRRPEDSEAPTSGDGRRPEDSEAPTSGDGRRPEDSEAPTSGDGRRPEDSPSSEASTDSNGQPLELYGSLLQNWLLSPENGSADDVVHHPPAADRRADDADVPHRQAVHGDAAADIHQLPGEMDGAAVDIPVNDGAAMDIPENDGAAIDIPHRPEDGDIQPQRDGNRLIIRFPPPKSFRCTENCPWSSSSTLWTNLRQSLERHLFATHDVVILSHSYVCAGCNIVLGSRPTLHRCPRNRQLRMEPPELQHQQRLRFRCENEGCHEAFPSKIGLKNHKAAHRRQTAREAQRLGLRLRRLPPPLPEERPRPSPPQLQPPRLRAPPQGGSPQPRTQQAQHPQQHDSPPSSLALSPLPPTPSPPLPSHTLLYLGMGPSLNPHQGLALHRHPLQFLPPLLTPLFVPPPHPDPHLLPLLSISPYLSHCRYRRHLSPLPWQMRPPHQRRC
nr:uncharacterized protein LOC128687585 [Cherax quadricarinatus]